MKNNASIRENTKPHVLSEFMYGFNQNLNGTGYEQVNIESIIRTYIALGDSQSRALFIARLVFSITKDFSVMNDYFDNYLISYEDSLKALLPDYVFKPNANLFIFGAGIAFWHIRHCMPSIQWRGVIDNHYGNSGDILCGLPIMRFDEFLAQTSSKDTYIGIAVSGPQEREAIKRQILDSGIDYDKYCFDLVPAFNELNIISEKQYFDCPGLMHASNEVFVDCGAFDASSTKAFIDWCQGDYKSIHAFEPDVRQQKYIRKTLNNAHDFTLYDIGCSDKSEVLKFYSNVPSQMSVASDKRNAGTTSVKVARLDDVIGSEKVTFIKMDIEGAEYQALSGAKKIITSNKPKLAICVYHRPEDIVKIPELIHNMRGDYKFYLRHPFYSSSQTVLFAL